MNALRTATAVWLATAGLAVAQDQPRQEQNQRGYLGVVTAPAAEGERVVSVDPNGPAAAAGLKAGDVLLKLDNQAIDPKVTLRNHMDAKKPSQIVALTVRDASGNVQTRNVTLRERPETPNLPRSLERMFGDDAGGFADSIAQAQFLQPPGPRPMLGVTVVDPDADMRQRLNLGDAKGVLISEVRPNTPAADAKLQANDLVQSVDGKEVTSAGELQRLIGDAKPDAQVKLKVLRGGQSVEVPVTVKSMTPPAFPPGFPGMGGMMPGPGNLAQQVNDLRQRVQTLEARIQALEQRLSGGGQPDRGTPGAGGAPPPAPKGPTNPPPPPRGAQPKAPDR
jgi:predicted metalloprotease with PDZ domain